LSTTGCAAGGKKSEKGETHLQTNLMPMRYDSDT
jgi:hypothetical protein